MFLFLKWISFVINIAEEFVVEHPIGSGKIQDITLDDNERETYLNKKMESDRLITTYKNNLLKATELLKSNPDGIPIGAAMVIKYDNAAYVLAKA